MQNKFSYPLKLEDMSATPKTYHLKANPAHLKETADLLRLSALHSLNCDITVSFDKTRHQVDVTGRLSAQVEHTSVISLQTFIRPYQIDFYLTYDPELTYAKQRELEDFSDINADIPEVMENKQIDLAAITVEQLALNLDDFPKKEGETFNFVSEFDETDNLSRRPFEILKKIKKS
ncbi:MAG: DUF177 domain-containing protein [Alphaproteobacteria bacterium]|nr:DUF177 domain-containing protein [Alphaproteobacteria bacterium]